MVRGRRAPSLRGPATLARKLTFLGDPRSYAPRPARVRIIETHFAYVFLAGRFAWKLKKPARQAGMDYRALAARRRGCEQELGLNRRLAPSIYLAVVPLTTHAGRLRLDGHGRVVDYLVKMRRLPSRATLDRQLARGRVPDLGPVIGLLADFYAGAKPAPLSPRRYRARFEAQIALNLRALRAHRAAIDWARAERIAGLQRRFLRDAAPLVGARGAHLVDAHGDLRAEHVCLAPLAVIDCLEFDRSLRRLDPHEDAALLALEIEMQDAALARDFLRRLAARRADPVPACLTHIYRSHRALTRAKLAAWHLGDPQFPDAKPWLARAGSYLRRAEHHARLALRAPKSTRRGQPRVRSTAEC
jgi:aminoglycoside phosphotransferase family enzyme